MTARLSLLSVALFALLFGTPSVSAQKGEKPSVPAKLSRKEIGKLIEQLKSDRFKERETATRRLMECEEALPMLQESLKSENAEVVRRAKKAIEAIEKRMAKRALRRAVALLKQGKTDQFVELVVRWRQYMDEDCWKAALEHAQIIADKAGKLHGRCKFKALPRVDLDKLEFIQTKHLKVPPEAFLNRHGVIADRVTTEMAMIRDSFLICDRSVEVDLTLGWSVVFVNGDLKVGITGKSQGILLQSIVVCDGNVTVWGQMGECVILATGAVSVGIPTGNSVIVSGGDVKISDADFPGVGPKNCLIQQRQNKPLDFIHFFDPVQVGIEVKSAKKGVRVEALAATRAFAHAGIRTGDQILALDSVKVDSAETFRRLLRQRIQESKPIPLEIRREEKSLRIEVREVRESP